jgi:hypothetical protein
MRSLPPPHRYFIANRPSLVSFPDTKPLPRRAREARCRGRRGNISTVPNQRTVRHRLAAPIKGTGELAVGAIRARAQLRMTKPLPSRVRRAGAKATTTGAAVPRTSLSKPPRSPRIAETAAVLTPVHLAGAGSPLASPSQKVEADARARRSSASSRRLPIARRESRAAAAEVVNRDSPPRSPLLAETRPPPEPLPPAQRTPAPRHQHLAGVEATDVAALSLALLSSECCRSQAALPLTLPCLSFSLSLSILSRSAR